MLMVKFLDKSEEDSDFGCRGVISLQKATIKVSWVVISINLC